ncbi:MAG: DDE-type integrase/transposase/recombinase [Pseudomonadota bacterium]
MTAREWMTAAEIAAAQLPGVPGTKRRINSLAESSNWCDVLDADGTPLARPNRGRGGGLQYHISLLPAAAQEVLREQYLAEQVDRVSSPGGAGLLDWPRPKGTKAAQAQEARACVLALLRAHRFAGDTAGAFTDAYNAGLIDRPDWLAEVVPKLNRRTLLRWKRAQAARGFAGIKPGLARRGRKSDLEQDTAAVEFLSGLIIRQPALTAQHLRALLLDKQSKLLNGAPIPKIWAIAKWRRRWEAAHRVPTAYLADPDDYRRRHKLSVGKSNEWVSRPNQLWEADASPTDVLLANGKRHTLYVCLDVYTRRMVCTIAPTARGSAMRGLIRKSIMAMGVPDTIRTDNGSDFVSYNSQFALEKLAIGHDRCRPYDPNGKAMVERAIRTINHDLLPLLPGYIGHDVAARKKIEARKSFAARREVGLSQAELQERLDAWVDKVYHTRPHRGLDGVSPAMKLAGWGGTLKKIENERALDVLLGDLVGKDGSRKVTHQGLLIEGHHYIHESLALAVGDTVRCHFDGTAAGIVHVFRDDDTYICSAQCPELLGRSRNQVAGTIKRAQSIIRKAATDKVRKATAAVKKVDLAERIIASEEIKAGNVAAFPRPAQTHTTVALDSYDIATGEIETPPLTAEQQAALDEVTRDLATPQADEQTAQEKYLRVQAIRTAQARKMPVDADDLAWANAYEASSEYATSRMMIDDFGDAWLGDADNKKRISQ